MNYFLVKTDPDTYSAADFEREEETLWDGVHNYAAINFIKQMRPKDTIYIYESQTSKAIVALAKVIGEPHKNEDDPRFSWVVRLRFMEKITPVTLASIKAEPCLKDFDLVRQPRLSVMKVPAYVVEWLKPLL